MKKPCRSRMRSSVSWSVNVCFDGPPWATVRLYGSTPAAASLFFLPSSQCLVSTRLFLSFSHSSLPQLCAAFPTLLKIIFPWGNSILASGISCVLVMGLLEPAGNRQLGAAMAHHSSHPCSPPPTPLLLYSPLLWHSLFYPPLMFKSYSMHLCSRLNNTNLAIFVPIKYFCLSSSGNCSS